MGFVQLQEAFMVGTKLQKCFIKLRVDQKAFVVFLKNIHDITIYINENIQWATSYAGSVYKSPTSESKLQRCRDIATYRLNRPQGRMALPTLPSTDSVIF